MPFYITDRRIPGSVIVLNCLFSNVDMDVPKLPPSSIPFLRKCTNFSLFFVPPFPTPDYTRLFMVQPTFLCSTTRQCENS